MTELYEVCRPINGVSLNGMEYLIAPNGGTMVFGSPELAEDWLRQRGFTDEEIAGFIIRKYTGNGKANYTWRKD